MSFLPTIASKVDSTMEYAAPATPPRRSYNTRAAGPSTPAAVFFGLLTPPSSVSKHGRTIGHSAIAPNESTTTEFDEKVDDIAPTQPSISSGVSAVTTYSHMTEAASFVISGNAPSNPFELLAIELVQNIAGHIDSDQDLIHFSQSCKHVNGRIEEGRNSFWRRRFLSTYEKPRNVAAKKWATNNLEYKKQYQNRRYSLKNGALFKLGKTGPEKACLQILRDLINDSFSQHKYLEEKYPGMVYEDGNLAALVRFCQNEDILRSILDPRNAPRRRAVGSPAISEPLLQAIQTVLSPLILCEVGGDTHDFPSSQIAAYSPATKSPIFVGCYGGNVNMDWILHQFNFWKYHFTREAESTLFTDIAAVDPADLPKLWNSQLSQQRMPALGKKWRGISAFLQLDEMNNMREDNPRDDIMDEFSGADNGGAVQDLALRLSPHDTTPEVISRIFTNALNDHLPKKRARTRSDQGDDTTSLNPRPFRMENSGGGCKDGQWIGDGWLSSLPSQSGIPGWQRMTMMKYWIDSNGNIDNLTLWAYEGVVLPGGRTVIGRWWSPDENANTDEQYSGPFIMWNSE